MPRAAYPQARASSPRTPARPHLRCGLLDLASGGVCQAIPVTRNAGALLPHRFTLTTARVAVYFLWHFPASHLGLLLAITLLCEVRTFLDSALHEREPRPPSQLVRVEPRYSSPNAETSGNRRSIPVVMAYRFQHQSERIQPERRKIRGRVLRKRLWLMEHFATQAPHELMNLTHG